MCVRAYGGVWIDVALDQKLVLYSTNLTYVTSGHSDRILGKSK